MCQNLSADQVQAKCNEDFIQWFNEICMSGHYEVDPQIKVLAQGPIPTVKSYKGYIINGFRFHTMAYGREKITMNSGVCVKATIGESDETNFYGMLHEILELEYWGIEGLPSVVLFNCDWYDNTRGMRIHPSYRLVDIDHRLRFPGNEPFILACQAQQVYYTPYPAQRVRRGWWAVCATTARHIVDTSSLADIDDDVHEAPEIYQDNEVVPISGLVIDFSSYNLIKLADDEVWPVNDENVGNSSNSDDENIGSSNNSDDEVNLDSDDD